MKRSIMLLLVFCVLFCAACAGPSGQKSNAVAQPTEAATAEPIRIDPAELTLSEGDSGTLSVSGAEDIQWSVQDQTIATVDNDGTVTGVLEGETTVQATAGDGGTAECHIIVEARKALSLDGAQITIDDKMEHVKSADGTDCIMTFNMQAVNTNGSFEGRAMLESVGVKDVGADIPAVGKIAVVSNVSFALIPEPEQPESTEDPLAPLVNVDYRGKGTFHFIMTDVGFMALETEGDIGLSIDIPFEVIVTGDDVSISFTFEPTFLSFRGKIDRNPA